MKSHRIELKPSVLLCLVCLAIVHRLRPRWVSVSLKDAAASECVSAQRLSRLCSKAILLFDRIIKSITRMGRPPVEQAEAVSELPLLRALLQVTTKVLSQTSLGKPGMRELLVGAYLRLKEQYHQLTQKDFCVHLSLPERTLRDWLLRHRKQPTQVSVAESKRPIKKTRQRRPRFGFNVTIPGTQIGADTTDFSAFDVGLKLMASQDIGGRDQNLFESILVDDHENADLISQMLCDAIGNRKGVQVICDQGTPYLAQKTKGILEELDADHTPQREGDPQGKATVEKAFDTIKRIAKPLLDITNRLAKTIQALRKSELAKATATVVFTALLRAYQAGARAARRAHDARAGMSEDVLLELAERSREKAHAEDRSARLLLTRIHELYAIEQPILFFIRNLRTFPLEVLKKAELAFGHQAHRNDIRKRGAYFAAVVRKINDEYQNRKAQERTEKEQEKIRQQKENKAHLRQKTWMKNPCLWLYAALKALAHQWVPEKSMMLFGGRGLGLAWLTQSIAHMETIHGPTTTRDLAAGVLLNFRNSFLPEIGPKGVEAIHSLLKKNLPQTEDRQTDCIKNFGSAILRNCGSP